MVSVRTCLLLFLECFGVVDEGCGSAVFGAIFFEISNVDHELVFDFRIFG